ncbi:hypothetical protein [Microbacterium sp.]|uniref:hypothetical protein n=1 Tax=Microbacterium sp. TaxID=51671 RepID=UPI003A8AF99F
MLPSPLPAVRAHLAFAASACGVILLNGCAATPAATPQPREESATAVAGPEEVARAQRSLAVVDSAGALTLTNLVETTPPAAIAGGAHTEVTALRSDGRFLFRVSGDGAHTRIDVVDSGVWTAPHGEHTHSYRAPSREISGAITGTGPAHVRSTVYDTTVAFPAEGTVYVLDAETLADGEIGEPQVIATAAHEGLRATPYAGVTLVTVREGEDTVIAAFDADGERMAPTAPCPEPRDVEVTDAAAVFLCADAAVVTTRTRGELAFDTVPLPAAAGPALLRGHGDALVGIGAAGDLWRLDVRNHVWTSAETVAPLRAAIGVDDDEVAAVAVDAEGRAVTVDHDGAVRATSAPIVPRSARAEPSPSIRMVTDDDGVYVLGADDDVVAIVDYRDTELTAVTVAASSPEDLALVG